MKVRNKNPIRCPLYRKSNTLDLLLANNNFLIAHFAVVPPFANSNHESIEVFIFFQPCLTSNQSKSLEHIFLSSKLTGQVLQRLRCCELA